LNKGCIGLHGTNDPLKIGLNASHGCVRHKNDDIKRLYGLVPVGTPVYIVEKVSETMLEPEDAAYLKLSGSPLMVAQLGTVPQKFAFTFDQQSN
jgi:hypothetical protein